MNWIKEKIYKDDEHKKIFLLYLINTMDVGIPRKVIIEGKKLDYISTKNKRWLKKIELVETEHLKKGVDFYVALGKAGILSAFEVEMMKNSKSNEKEGLYSLLQQAENSNKMAKYITKIFFVPIIINAILLISYFPINAYILELIKPLVELYKKNNMGEVKVPDVYLSPEYFIYQNIIVASLISLFFLFYFILKKTNMKLFLSTFKPIANEYLLSILFTLKQHLGTGANLTNISETILKYEKDIIIYNIFYEIHTAFKKVGTSSISKVLMNYNFVPSVCHYVKEGEKIPGKLKVFIDLAYNIHYNVIQETYRKYDAAIDIVFQIIVVVLCAKPLLDLLIFFSVGMNPN